MFEASIRGWFAAAHQLRLPDGTFEPLHGHNWGVEVTFASETLDEMGVVVDFVAAKRCLDEILRTFHDGNLNESVAFARRNPSAEHVAAVIAEQMTSPPGRPTGAWLACVEVEEAPGCVARVRPVRGN